MPPASGYARSSMPFDESSLSPALRRNLTRLGYHEPTPVQAQTFGPALEGRDLVAIARTGSGKTTAFILPIAEAMLRGTSAARTAGSSAKPGRANATRPRALVLCPTRELAVQVAAEAEAIVSGSVLRVLCVHGKVALSPQVAALAEGVDLVVATPGRCQELLDSGALQLSRIRHVVLDEADRMLDLGFDPQVRSILGNVPTDRQTLLFSATMPSGVAQLAQELLRHALQLDVDPTTTAVGHVTQRLVRIQDELKVPLLRAVLAGMTVKGDGATSSTERTGVLVFCRTRRRAHWIGTALRRHGVDVGFLHGDRSHAQRERALARFSRGVHRVLVATDVAARGLHVPAVRTVVNYDVALAPEEHVHRIGRAAHGLEGRGGTGEAITFLAEDDRERWRAVVTASGVSLQEESPPAISAYMEGVPGYVAGGDDREAGNAGGERGERRAPRRRAKPDRDVGAPVGGRNRRESSDDVPARKSASAGERRGTEGHKRTGERASDGRRAGTGERSGTRSKGASSTSSRPDRPGPRSRDDRKPDPFRRPKKSRPIKKGEKPGGGVRRIG